MATKKPEKKHEYVQEKCPPCARTRVCPCCGEEWQKAEVLYSMSPSWWSSTTGYDSVRIKTSGAWSG